MLTGTEEPPIIETVDFNKSVGSQQPNAASMNSSYSGVLEEGVDTGRLESCSK